MTSTQPALFPPHEEWKTCAFPYCSVRFLKTRPNQSCCTPEHTNALSVIRQAERIHRENAHGAACEPIYTPEGVSRQAVKRALPRLSEAHERIEARLAFLDLEGATDEQLQLFLNLNPNTERPRRRELVLMGKVQALRDASGAIVTRPTRSGSKATVWVLKEAR